MYDKVTQQGDTVLVFVVSIYQTKV